MRQPKKANLLLYWSEKTKLEKHSQGRSKSGLTSFGAKSRETARLNFDLATKKTRKKRRMTFFWKSLSRGFEITRRDSEPLFFGLAANVEEKRVNNFPVLSPVPPKLASHFQVLIQFWTSRSVYESSSTLGSQKAMFLHAEAIIMYFGLNWTHRTGSLWSPFKTQIWKEAKKRKLNRKVARISSFILKRSFSTSQHKKIKLFPTQ